MIDRNTVRALVKRYPEHALTKKPVSSLMKRPLYVLAVWFALLPTHVWGADLLVDHVEYVRTTGVVQEMSLFFPGCDPQGRYTLTIMNGRDDLHRANGGSVVVNGVELVRAADFTQSPAPAVITRTIDNVSERNTLNLSVTAPQGSVIGWQVTAEVTCPEITILSPLPEAVINRTKIAISGKVRHRTPEVGVSVNGVQAEVNGNDWAANGVELTTGVNTLTATVIREDETTAEISASVTSQDQNVSSIDINSIIGSGAAPLKVNFFVENFVRTPIVSYLVDYEGDGTIDLETSTLKEFEHIYPREGLFPAKVVARDDQGRDYSSTFIVNVHPLPHLKSMWEKMKVGLAAGDIEAAVKCFRDTDKQRMVFTAIAQQAQQYPEKPSLSALATAMEYLEFIELQGDTAEYRISREETVDGVPTPISYYVHFTKNHNGLWRLEQF